MTPTPTVASLVNLTKSYGPTKAVREVSLDIPRGAIIGLVGENGAGKSTLAKMLAGVVSPDSGQLIINGVDRSFRGPYEAINSGVAMMAQEITLVPDRTVEENVLLGNLPRKGIFPLKKQMRERYLRIMKESGFDLDPDLQVGRLRIADQQKVELMRALSQQAELIIMDEPSAALTADEVTKLHGAIRDLASQGTSVVLVSHFLEEVLALTSHVAIMRDGELIRYSETKNETADSLVASMVGKSLSTEYAEAKTVSTGPIKFSVKNLSTSDHLTDISFDIKRGEILGLAGLVGAGRTEIARAIYGVDRISSGEIVLDGQSLKIKSPQQAIKSGIFMIPESRKDQGLVLNGSIRDNLLLASMSKLATFGITSNSKFSKIAARLSTAVDLRFGKLNDPVSSLSGGNQQKILFGRVLELQPSVLIVDEPTRGVDIAAKRAIHALLDELAAAGTAILFISSEIEEVLGVCHRTIVIHKGQVHGVFVPPYNKTQVVAAFFGQGEN
jgi:rhamnose transport system ATP-binding protein